MIMNCPKCGGCGKMWIDTSNGGQPTSLAPYSAACSSCGGTGYVTDTPQYATPHVKCSKCGYDMTINWVCTECQIARK